MAFLGFAPRQRYFAATLLTVFAASLVGCGENAPTEGGGAGAMFGGPMPVGVITVNPERIPLNLEYTGQTLGSREAEVRARVAGILVKRNFEEGAIVKAGQSLFTIDPAPFEVALERANADLAAAEARLDQAKREAARLKPLFEDNVVSRQEYDNAVSAQTITAADVLAAKARVKEAQLNLEWTRVEAPISGVTSRAITSEGSLVSGPEVLLTTVTQVDPIHILFGIPDNERLRLNREVQEGRLQWPPDGRFEVAVLLADGSEHSRKGVVNFTDARINANTGTSEARAELPNPDMALRPGQFVRVRLSGAMRPAAYKIPQRAILEGPQGKFVYVVDADNKAAIRPIDVGEWTGEHWVVTKGLDAGDNVIVDGVLKLGPGAPVMAGDPNAAAPPPQP